MSLRVVLEKEDGTKLPQRIGDAGHTLIQLLVDRTQESAEPFYYLPYVDPYGDTIFNCLQAEPVLAELARLRQFELSDREAELLAGVEGIVRACQESNGLYVRFAGD